MPTDMWFADSDVHKTLEAAAWQLGRSRTTRAARVPRHHGRAGGQGAGDEGYLNPYFAVDRAWAAVAGAALEPRAVLRGPPDPGRRGCRAGRGGRAARHGRPAFADLIVRPVSAVDDVDGHPEIETALVELYRMTGHRPTSTWPGGSWTCAGTGCSTASGRLARTCRTTSRSGRPTMSPGTRSGSSTCRRRGRRRRRDRRRRPAGQRPRLWARRVRRQDLPHRRPGLRHRDEAFGDPYELPPDRAYGETCAGIASIQWSWRLLLATGEAQVRRPDRTHAVQRVRRLTSLDGTHFFYANPLQRRTDTTARTRTRRRARCPWYSCACCPPNLARLVASLPGTSPPPTTAGSSCTSTPTASCGPLGRCGRRPRHAHRLPVGRPGGSLP